MAESIPEMTDPLGRYWGQPSREKILVDDDHAVLTRDDFEKLARYDASIPTGVYAGKMWVCEDVLCWFGEVIDDRCRIHCRTILIVEEAGHHG